jgi:KDO2-lipid IV(A) lauroyltransferase
MWKYFALLIALHTLGRLPLAVLYRICDLAGELLFLLAPRLRRRVIDNMRHVLGPAASRGEVRRAARKVFRNVARYYADLITIPRLDVRQFYERRLHYWGFDEYIAPALGDGRGVIVVSCHFGSPELAIQGLIPLGVKALCLTEPLSPPRLSRLVDRLRSSQGHTFLPVSVGSVKAAIRYLKRGGLVALMGDRDVEGPRALLPFLGQETYIPTGPVELAMRTGAVLVPVFSYRRDGRIEVVVEPPLDLERTGSVEEDVRLNTLRFLHCFERHLRRDPGQWIVMEAIWDSQPGEGRR